MAQRGGGDLYYVSHSQLLWAHAIMLQQVTVCVREMSEDPLVFLRTDQTLQLVSAPA